MYVLATVYFCIVSDVGFCVHVLTALPKEMTPKLIRITHSLMRTWAQRAAIIQSSSAPHVVEKLLQRLLLEKRIVEESEEKEGEHKRTVEIYLENYNSVLEAWSNTKEPGSADRAAEILLQMEQQEHGPKPNLRSYNAVIKALVKNGDRQSAASKVEDLVLRMESKGDPNILPNRRSYNFLLYALANCNHDDAAERATRHLEHMIDRTKRTASEDKSIDLVQPDVNSFNQVIGAWARGKTPNYLQEMQKVYNLLLEVSEEYDIQPDVDTYNNMMGGWLKSRSSDRGALLEIQKLFSTMEESYRNGNDLAQPDRVSVNSLQTAFNKFSVGSNFTKQIELETEYDLPRNSHSLNILMEGIMKSGAGDAPEQSLQILTEMENHLKNGELSMKPDVCSYIAVIKAHVTYKRKNTEKKTDELLARMWYLHREYDGAAPDIAVYNCVLNAYASIKSKRVLNKVRDILRKMENGEIEGVPKPNLITYNTVIKAMRNGNKEKGAVTAEEILSKLEILGKHNPELLPDNYSYTSVITAYARSSARNKAEKALEMIERMTEAQRIGNQSAEITAHTFNAALNACAFVTGTVEEQAKAFEIATKLDKLRVESGELGDSTWYGTMLRACSSLIPRSEYREKMVDLFFQEACEKGCVGPLVLQQLRFAADREQQMRLLKKKIDENEYVELDQLPREWTNHAREWQPSHVKQ